MTAHGDLHTVMSVSTGTRNPFVMAEIGLLGARPGPLRSYIVSVDLHVPKSNTTQRLHATQKKPPQRNLYTPRRPKRIPTVTNSRRNFACLRCLFYNSNVITSDCVLGEKKSNFRRTRSQSEWMTKIDQLPKVVIAPHTKQTSPTRSTPLYY